MNIDQNLIFITLTLRNEKNKKKNLNEFSIT